MYSVVLMMAMTSGGDVADNGHRHGGCCGGYESYSSCSGGSYSGCCGGSYSGCCGGGHHRHHRHHGGGCCGGESYGCCGGYSGYSGCNGGYAGYSGCTGGQVIIGDGHEHHEMHDGDHDGHHEGHHDDKKGGKGPEEEIKKPAKPEAATPAPATIIVSLPANATLTIDDAATTSTASTRVFTSPVLPAGKDFHYTLKAQYIRAGQPVVLSREVTVRAGEETRVNLQAGLAGVASR
ncbi:MAG TPA: hypothetical protein DDY78_21930 [Planctomycetales bacterium]|jgi:uncharacterized protein (TIGR03000 family)|nr:hypothetical protein [Planctomycetales bacterium]